MAHLGIATAIRQTPTSPGCQRRQTIDVGVVTDRRTDAAKWSNGQTPKPAALGAPNLPQDQPRLLTNPPTGAQS